MKTAEKNKIGRFINKIKSKTRQVFTRGEVIYLIGKHQEIYAPEKVSCECGHVVVLDNASINEDGQWTCKDCIIEIVKDEYRGAVIDFVSYMRRHGYKPSNIPGHVIKGNKTTVAITTASVFKKFHKPNY